MASLPKSIHENLRDEFKFAASKVAEATTVSAKAFYFSAFFGQTGRQLNMHWDADLALLWSVVQHASNAINGRLATASGEYPTAGFPEGFLEAIDEVSTELAGAFEGDEIDVPRLYAALARTSELTYLTTGNGIYLYEKGFIKLMTYSSAPEQPS